MSAESSPKIVIVDESPIRAAILEEGLREAGFTGVVHISEMQSLLARIYALDPDVILIDLENPSRDVLEQMFQVSRAVRRPIAMFVDQSDAASIQASVDAGVSAYIVDGLTKIERLRDIVSVARDGALRVLARPQDLTLELTPAAKTLIVPLEARVRERLGRAVFGTDEVEYEGVVAELIRHHGLTIAVAECAQVVPNLREVQPGHQVACIRV